MEVCKPAPCVATIGFFDGVHRGHRYLIDQVIREAKLRRLESLLISFAEHPRKVMQADYQPQLLTPFEEKRRRMEATGVDRCSFLHFTPTLSQLTAYEFMQKVLRDELSVRVLVIGYDHRFGHNREEGFDDYVRYGRELGIEVIRSEAFVLKGVHVSSSVIRAFLGEGEVQLAEECLGYRYALQGKVVDGFKVGRTLGYPTANLQPLCSDQLLPARGVYAVSVTVGKARYHGMLNIGNRPTLENGEQTTIEVHLLRYSGDLYQQTLTVEFVARLRDEKKFRRVEELQVQLARDAEAAEKACAAAES